MKVNLCFGQVDQLQCIHFLVLENRQKQREKLRKLSDGKSHLTFPRIVIGGLGGGSGKTIVTLGLIKSLRNRGSR